MSSENQTPSESQELPPLLSELLVIEALPKWVGRLPHANSEDAEEPTRALVISPGRAQSSIALAKQAGIDNVEAWYLDLHQATTASASLPDSIEVLSGFDLPDHRYRVVVLPVFKRSESELTRDLMQQAHDRLCEGGLLVTSVDNAKDNWLHDQMQSMFDKVTSERAAKGCVYWAKKTNPLKKTRDFECEFEYRDDNQTITAISRPGVFSHRRLDPGAKQLMLSAEIGAEDNVLDMGTGCGAIALAAAMKTTGQVFGVDSNARAVQCLTQGAEKMGLTNVEAIWNADGDLKLPVQVDLALANPPYFGDDTISQHFVDSCLSALRPGGALLVVTKQPNWYEAYFDGIGLEDIVIFEAGKYFVACGRIAEMDGV